MKKVFLSLVAITTIVVACKKECDDKPAPEPEVIRDTVYVTSPEGCTPNLSKGLLAYYPFNNNFNDESGNGNTATANNGAFLTADYAGRANSCAGFDGSNDYLLVPASTKLNSDTFTVSVLVMANSINRSQSIVSRTNFETATATAWGVGVPLPSDNKWAYTITSNAEDCSKQHQYDVSGTVYDKNLIVPGRWYNVIAVFAGGAQKLYVNGVLQSSATRAWTKAKQCPNSDIVIGGWWKGGVNSLDGKIDDVRLYNRVLSDCEIAKLAESFK